MRTGKGEEGGVVMRNDTELVGVFGCVSRMSMTVLEAFFIRRREDKGVVREGVDGEGWRPMSTPSFSCRLFDFLIELFLTESASSTCRVRFAGVCLDVERGK